MGDSIPNAKDSPLVRAAFVERCIEDVLRGGLRPLEEYQNAFPGFESLIEEEYARLAVPDTTFLPDAPSSGSHNRKMDAPAPPFDSVEGYTILGVLGQGGMGTVYLAEQHPPLVRRVAIKVIKRGMDTREIVARFESERQATARMRHSGIAQVYEAGSTRDGRPYFAMELVAGTPLNDFCNQHCLGIRERLELFEKVCAAVQHAHQNGVLHRDLKPSNILVSEHEGLLEPKVIDFGVAKSLTDPLTDEASPTQVGQIMGTPDYMSPEQADLGGIGLDTRADIYSLGVVLHELLTGRVPFHGDDEQRVALTEKLRRIASDAPLRPSQRVARLGEKAREIAAARRLTIRQLVRVLRNDLDWVVLKTLEKDRERRYASASELGAEVRRYLSAEPLLAGPPTFRYRMGKAAQKHRVAILVVLGSLLTAAAAGLFARGYSQKQAFLSKEEQARKSYTEGEGLRVRFQEGRQAAQSLEREWSRLRAGMSAWRPSWDREEEFAAWDAWQKAARSLPELHQRAFLAFHTALETSPVPFESAREALLGMVAERFQELYWNEAEHLAAEDYRSLAAGIDGATEYLRRLEGDAVVSIRSEPAGASTYCFRFETIEGRLFPLPFQPTPGRDGKKGGITGEPFLEVEQVWSPTAGLVFRVGDRLSDVAGIAVRTLKDVVKILNRLNPDEVVTVRLLREDQALAFKWQPFSGAKESVGNREASLEKSHIVAEDDLRVKLGLTFAGFPLDVSKRCFAGSTSESAPLSWVLPPGSYLFVLRKDGFLPARLPVAVPRHPDEPKDALAVRLWKAEEVPPGFVPVTGGTFFCGADPRVDQPLPSRLVDVADFFMARHEVTAEEYLEFLNSPETSARLIEETGYTAAVPQIDWKSAELAPMLPSDPVHKLLRQGRVLLVPRTRCGERLCYIHEQGRWQVENYMLKWPVIAVSTLAALEYARWLTEVKYAGKWLFRLASDLEWEKAARGVDRRPYVWGHYHVWSFCASGQSQRENSGLRPPGAFPLDESVYGVRDLAGSVAETLRDVRGDGTRFVSSRGGSWQDTDAYYFRAANRNGRLAEESYASDGVRLVAVPLPAAE